MKAALAIIATLLLGTCSQPPTVLEQIMRAGELRVVTRNLPSTYYLGASGPQGPEFELASRFAAELGVRLYMYSVPNVGDVMRELESHRAHIAAAGLTRGMRLPPQTAFGPPYQQVREHLIFRQGSARARNLQQAVDTHIEVVAGSSHAATLEQARVAVPNLSWVENPSAETEELLYRLSRREFDYTVADSNEFAIGRAFHPDIRIAFDLSGGKALAWAVDGRDPSLLQARDGVLCLAESRRPPGLDPGHLLRRHRPLRLHPVARLHRRYRSAPAAVSPLVSRGGRAGGRRLAAAGGDRLSGIALGTDGDLATGVRGLMMLTEDTARGLGVVDRLDPRESIFGGAQYFLRDAQSDSRAHSGTGPHLDDAGGVQRRLRPSGRRAHPHADARQESGLCGTTCANTCRC